MKKNVKYRLIPLILFFAVCGVLIWIVNQNSHLTDLEKIYLVQPVEQETDERKWNDVQFERVMVGNDVLNPFWIEGSENGFVYVADHGDFTIKKYDLDGNLIQVFGNGNGRGPGEFLMFSSIYLDKEKRIWVADQYNSRITIFNQNGSWDIHHSEEIPMRALPVDPDTYVLSTRFDSQLQIRKFSDPVRIHSEPLLVQEGSLWAYVLASLFATDHESTFVRAFFWTNDIVRYTKTGEIIYFRRPINSPGVDELVITPPRRYESDQEVWFNEVDPSSRAQKTVDIKILNGQIHLLISAFRGEERIRDSMDVYDLQTGDYRYSYRLPQSLLTFTVTENHLAGIIEDTAELVVWEVSDEW